MTIKLGNDSDLDCRKHKWVTQRFRIVLTAFLKRDFDDVEVGSGGH